MPAHLEHKPEETLPPQVNGDPPPSTIDHPERKPRYISLSEAIAMGLEKGTTGNLLVRQVGTIPDDLLSWDEISGEFRSDSNCVLALRPALEGVGIEQALARFDPIWVSGVTWSTNDQPIQGLGSFQVGQGASFESSLVKPLPTGGVAGITFLTNYQNLRFPPTGFPIQNPAYAPELRFTFDHPLLQGFGDINQLLTTSPTPGVFTRLSTLGNSGINGRTGSVVNNRREGILLARLSFDQSRAEFERIVNFKLLNIEAAYWNLYGAYVNLYAAERAMYQAYEVWRLTKVRYDAGRDPLTDYAQVRGQYEQFRGDRLQALGKVLEAERILRRLIGLPADDGCQLIPLDAPTMAPYYPDWCSALKECLEMRPELVMMRQQVRKAQLNVLVQQNFLKPDLKFSASWSLHGLGRRLDGNEPLPTAPPEDGRTTNALRELASQDFTDWFLGLSLNIPLGYRFEHAALRRAKLVMAQDYLRLKNEECKAQSFLAKAYRDIFENYKLIEARRAQREAFGEQVRARFEQYKAGLQLPEGKQRTPVDFLLEAQRQWANALSQEYQAIVSYNIALATFQFAKGTLLQHDNVVINEGPLPSCAQVRAVEHERERSNALLLRERANPVQHAPVCDDEHSPVLPEISSAVAPSLPALLEAAPPVTGAMEKLEPAPADVPARKTTGAIPITNREEVPVKTGTPAAQRSTGPSSKGILSTIKNSLAPANLSTWTPAKTLAPADSPSPTSNSNPLKLTEPVGGPASIKLPDPVSKSSPESNPTQANNLAPVNAVPSLLPMPPGNRIGAASAPGSPSSFGEMAIDPMTISRDPLPAPTAQPWPR